MYSVFNDALNQVFLSGRYESRPLYLVLDNRGRKELADLLETDEGAVEELCGEIVGSALQDSGDPYGAFASELRRWQRGSRKDLPPFTALLFALSHAAELMVSDGQFNAANYYQRLAALVCHPASRLSAYGWSTERFWRAFNGWLADEDFRFGRPTARAINSNRYVGIAMSQAIVREEDRNRFHSMFEKYGFTGTDLVTEEEIHQYIASWITTSKPTKQLKAVWAKPELRHRICEVAIAELEDWAEESAQSGRQHASQSSRLSMAASIRNDLLSRSIALWVGKEASRDLVDLSSSGETFFLSNSTYGSFATVEPRTKIDWAKALLRGLDFTDAEDFHHVWRARAVIPLSRSDKGTYWTEVNRVTLGVTHLVLARSEPAVRNGVERALEEIAAPGYTVATAESLPGLPAGWLLYENVRVLRALDELRGFEAALSPVGTTSGVQLFGGLRLGRDIWHQWEPPVAVFETGDAPAKLLAWEGTAGEGATICEADGADGEARLPLADCIPESGSLYVEGWRGKERLGTTTLLFRTAAKARPFDRQLRGVVAYRDAVTAAPIVGAKAPAVRGLVVPQTPSPEVPLVTLNQYGQLKIEGPVAEERPDLTQDPAIEPAVDLSKLDLAELLKLPCAVRGFHVFRLDTVPPDYPRYAPVNMECKDCHVALLHRRKAKVTKSVPRATRPRKAVPPSPRQASPREPKSLPFDLWFDAACFLGSGTSAAFEALVTSQELDPWQSRSVMRNLCWLGHLDVELGQDHRPKNWSVAPPTLAFIGEREAVLTGFRNSDLIDDIVDLVKTAGGKVERREIKDQPTLVLVSGLTPAEATQAIDVARDLHGRPVVVIENPASDLSDFCLAIGRPFSTMRPMSLGTDGPIRKYDLRQGRWRHVDSTSEFGAYSFSYAGTGYAFRSTAGCFSGSPELVKIAAARNEGLAVHAYLQDERIFLSQLGCEPPGLLGRALTACSGRLPEIKNGTSRFLNVSPSVAAAVLTALYNGELPS